jgi:hypothetical protein
MSKRLLPFLALLSLLPYAAATSSYAADPPPNDPGMAAEPEDPNAAPYPPDGVTDPNAVYPTDGTEGTDQGEIGAEAPPPAGGNDTPN